MAQVLPDALRVEVGYGSSPLTALASVTWTDVTSSVRLSQGVSFNRGRFGNDATARPGSLSFTLDNSGQAGSAGRFTSGGSKIELRVPVRVRARFPLGGATNVDLWYGYVEAVEAGWDAGFRPVLRVSASDRLARLQKRQLQSLIREQQQLTGSVAAWPLTDTQGSTAAGQQAGGNASSLRVSNRRLSSGLVFGGSELSPGPDSLPCAVFTPVVNAASGIREDGQFLLTRNLGADWTAATTGTTLEVFAYTSEISGSTWPVFELFDGGDTIEVFATNLSSSGFQFGLTVTRTTTGSLSDIVSSPTVANNRWHHLMLTQSLSGSTLTSTLYVDGSQAAQVAVTRSAGRIGSSLYVGANDAQLFSGRISHVALYDSVLSASVISDHALLRHTLSDYQAQTVAAIFNRICKVSDLPSTEYQVSGTTSATLSPVPVNGLGFLNAVNEVAAAENGVVYVNRSGIVTLAARSSRYNPSSAFTVPAKAVDAQTSFSTDMTYLVNDVTVKRPAGASSRYENSSSINAFDRVPDELTAYVATDNQAAELASRLARVNATPEPRVSDIKVDLVAAAADLDEDAILKAEVGTYFQVTNLPTGSPSSTLHLFVEGVAHQVSEASWQVTMTTTPASEDFFRGVWVLGDANLSQLGSTTVLAF